MKHALMILALALGGCTHTDFKPQDVDIAVAQACPAIMPGVPAFPLDTISPSAPMVDKAKAFAEQNEVHLGYEGQLRAALQACIAPVNKL